MIKVGNTGGHDSTYSQVAVVLPAYNEELTVGATVRAFQSALPGCTVVVCDNASEDRTREHALAAGAHVIAEQATGKGNAVRRLFATVDAETYVMADADETYDASSAPVLIEALSAGHLDMVTGVREPAADGAYRRGHVLGNQLFNKLFSRLFGVRTGDVFSGYRVLTRRFVRCLPVQSSGFEIEAEMTAMAAILKLSVGEVGVGYRKRHEGSISKLRTYHDGWRILLTYMQLVRHFYPKRFYGVAAGILSLLSLMLGIPVVFEFLETGLVLRFPTAILASSIGLIALMTFFAGLILEAVARLQIQQKLLFLRSYSD